MDENRSIFHGYDYSIFHGIFCAEHRERIANVTAAKLREFIAWSRRRPCANIFTWGWRSSTRSLCHVVVVELRSLLHRLNYNLRHQTESFGYACQEETYHIANALTRLCDERPWITHYDHVIFMRGWQAASELAKKGCFQGTCQTCFHWKKEANGYGVCRYGSHFTGHSIILPAMVTVGTFACSNFSKLSGDQKLDPS